jgi:capsular polysaccharide biosynthesis protein
MVFPYRAARDPLREAGQDRCQKIVYPGSPSRWVFYAGTDVTERSTLEPREFRDPYLDDEFDTGPHLSVLQSVRRRPFLVALAVGLLLLAGAVYGMGRSPKYTAEARLAVGGIDLSQPGALSAFASATQALASAYSRAVAAEDVTDEVARKTGLSPLEVRSRLVATPIPDSPLFRIEAEGTNAREAVDMANVTSNALSDYVKRTSTSRNPASGRLLREYRDVQVDVTRASQRYAQAQRDAGNSPSTDELRALARAKGALQAAKLRAQAVSSSYVSSTSGQSATQSVQILAPATSASSDRFSKLQIYLFVALVAGLILGAALATLAEDRRLRRSFRRR